VVRDENGEVKYHFVIIDFFVKLKGGEPKASSDAEELKWVPLNEVEKYNLTKTFMDFFKKNYKKLQKLSFYKEHNRL
jgi:ADP-ribose pyrophosphatase YjhB (NUDIX family)